MSVVGVDVKAQALQHNNGIAEALGVSDRVSFVEGSIDGSARGRTPPDLVLALHACDTATDDALARAVAWRAPVVVAAPCCHHDIARQLSAARRARRRTDWSSGTASCASGWPTC